MKKYTLFTLLVLLGFSQLGYSANFAEYMAILSMYVKNPSEVGEVAPLSKNVGVEIARFVIADLEKGKNYLEAGGGFGSISVCIAKKLGLNDHLDVVEINPKMCEVLKKRLAKYPNVTVHCCSILDWHPDYQYDAIVSTLPFLSLGIDFTQQAMHYFKSKCAKDGMFSCVEFPVCTFCRSLADQVCLHKAKNLTLVQKYMAKFRERYLLESTTIWSNIPPINVYHLKLA